MRQFFHIRKFQWFNNIWNFAKFIYFLNLNFDHKINLQICTITNSVTIKYFYEPQIENKINASSVNRNTANKQLKAAEQFSYSTQSRFYHVHAFWEKNMRNRFHFQFIFSKTTKKDFPTSTHMNENIPTDILVWNNKKLVKKEFNSWKNTTYDWYVRLH